tara:strand:+ start:324 stop:815 length:492 start_codon:yes stop_codon:yes gene_type:complete
MEIQQIFLVTMRWLHILATAAWIGGCIFFFAVLRPALRGSSEESLLNRLAGNEFRQLVDVAIWVLLVTGTILSIDRLTSGHSTSTYGIVFLFKLSFAIWMFYLVWFRNRSGNRKVLDTSNMKKGIISKLAAMLSATNLIMALGILVLLLSEFLGHIFEASIMR